jgi:hypothetical protein
VRWPHALRHPEVVAGSNGEFGRISTSRRLCDPSPNRCWSFRVLQLGGDRFRHEHAIIEGFQYVRGSGRHEITERTGIGNNDHASLCEVSSLALFAELVDSVQVLFEILERIHVDVALVEEGVQIPTRRQAEQGTELITGDASETVSFQAHGLQDGAGGVQTLGRGWGQDRRGFRL